MAKPSKMPMSIMPPPMVTATEQCNVFEADGTRCPEPTGSTESGIDVDLCPQHRKMMAKQRAANAKMMADLLKKAGG